MVRKISSEDRSSGLGGAVQDHYQALLKYLRRRTGDADEAADILHDTYLKLAEAKSSEAVEHPRAYIYRTAANLAVDQGRARQRRSTWIEAAGDEIDYPDSAPSAERLAIGRERLRALNEALQALPVKPRLALLMFRLDGLSHREIAGRLGVSESMVAKYLAQALKACRDGLAQLD